MPHIKSYRAIFLLLLMLLVIFAVQSQGNSPQLDATLQDSLLVDRDGDGRLDAGDTLRYTLEITNCGNAAAENAQFTGQQDPNTQFLANSVQVGAPEPAATCPPQAGGNPNPNPQPPVIPASGPPAVQNSSPTNGATEVALNSNITLQFNKAVNVTGDWFEIVCTSGTFNISSGNVAVTGGPINWTFDPNVDLQVGETCTVTVFAANVTDVDNNDPPDNMAADFIFSFTTENPPTVVSTTPVNGATAVLNSDDIVITFDEPVTVSAASFTLECPAGTPFAGGFAVSGSGTTTVTINPTGNLPSGTNCQIVAIADFITDANGNTLDGNNNNASQSSPTDDYTFSFTTDIDAAPTVVSVIPADGAVSVLTDTNIEITFSELVNIAGAGDFALECGGAPQGYTVTTPASFPALPTTIVIIDPTNPLPSGETCQVIAYGGLGGIEDADLDDPNDEMLANFIWTFTTEGAPSVTTTNPANGATGIGTGSNIVIDFNEPVDVISDNAFAIECPAGGTSYTFTVTGSGTNSITLDPDTNLIANQNCTVTVFASPDLVDSDFIEPPDTMLADYVFSFDTIADTAPVASSPLDGATGVATASNIVINFNEPVDVVDTPTPTFTLECPVGTPVAFTTVPALPTTNQTSITIDPTTVLPASSTCSVTVEADNVTDTDTDEPPDNMAADYSFTFDTIIDLAPTVDQPNIVPASTSTGANSASLNNPVSTTPTITIPFSEAVDVATGAFTLVCNATPVSFSTNPALPTTGQTSIDVYPTAPIAEGANCVLTVDDDNIADSDLDDPAFVMADDFTLSFSIDTAPSETLTETEVGSVFQDVTGAGAINVDLDGDIQITFNEAVTVTFPAAGLQCPVGNNIPATVTTNNAATIVINPDNNLPLNTLCVLNIPAANISDVDTADAPDNPVAAVTHSFTTVDDDAPTVTTNPAQGGSNIAVNSNITVTFNEPVTLTGGWFDLSCSVSGSGNRFSTGELTGTGITIIENTPDLVYTIDPTVDLTPGDVCTITIDSANVLDTDLIDPPNELDGNADSDIADGDADDYVATFSTMDMAPQVLNTTPASTDTVGAGQVVTINFTETVDIAVGAFSFECPAGTPLTSGFNTSVALPATAITTIDLTPVDPLPFGATCTVTIESTLVVDVDPITPPSELDGSGDGDLVDGDADDFFLNFQVDAEPTLLSSEVEIGGVLSPAAGAVNVDLDSNIVLTFSEAVNADLTSFDLECPAGTDIAFTVLGTGTTTITIDPTPAFLAINTLCDFDIIAANITDVDTFDTPDTLAADINFTFTTVNDDFPAVTSAEVEIGGVFTALPLGAGIYVDADTDLRISFSEAVTVTGNWAELDCTVSSIQDVSGGLTVADADPVFTLTPGTTLTAGEACTLTIFAAQIADDDAIDPPDNMQVDAIFTFTVLDTPPQVDTATSTPVDASVVANNQTVTFNFTEPVDIAAGGILFDCVGPVAFTPALPQNNVTSITLTPSSALPNGANCTVLLISTLIIDTDMADAPNELDGDFSNDIVDGDADDFLLTFTVDLPPTVTSATVEVAGVPTIVPLGLGTVVDLDSNIVINFSEPIDSTAAGATLECPAGNPIAFAGLPVTNNNSITINPSADLPGDTLCVVTVVAANTTDTDTFDTPNQLDGNGDTVEGDNYSFSFTTQAAAVDDAYTVTPHLTYDSALVGLSIRDNDQPTTVSITGFGDTLGNANAIVANGTNFITASGAGGRVVLNADGSFVFYPDAGDTAASGTVTFFYTITGGDTAQVTLTFEAEELVWFVDNTPPGTAVCTGTNVGTQACPSADLATVSAVDTSNDTIFVASGNYTCGIVLEASERFIGDGASSDLQTLSGVSPVAGSNFAPYSTFSGTDPVLTSAAADCITLATGNTIRGVTVGNTGNFAGIVGTAYGTATILETTINGDGQILNLDNGTVNATFDSLSSSSSDADFAALRVANSTVNFTSTGGTTIGGSAAGVEAILLIQNTGTGFNLGATSVNKVTAGRAVALGNGIVQSAPVTFVSLAITSSAGTALETNRQTGTVTVSANTGNISAVGGAAVNIINVAGNTTPLAMNLGALSANNSAVATTCLSLTSPAGFCATGGTGTMTASSLTVTTGTNRYGIRINNSSAAFTFATVSISGMVISSAETDTSPNDGYPDNTTSDGDGVFLSSNTGSFTINGGIIQNTTGSGADNVDIRASSNIVINNTTLSSAGKSNFQAINMTGTGSFNNGIVTNAAQAIITDAFYLRANSGTLTRFDIDNTNCTMSTSANAEDCFEFHSEGTHTALVDIGGIGDTGVWLTNREAVEATSRGTSNLTLNMESINVSPVSVGRGGFQLSAEANSTHIARIRNNNFSNLGNGLASSAFNGFFNIIPQDSGSTLRVRIEGNSVDIAASNGGRRIIYMVPLGSMNAFEAHIINNTLEGSGNLPVIYFRPEEDFTGFSLSNGDIFIQNNGITTTGTGFAARGIFIEQIDPSNSNDIRFDIRQNIINTSSSSTATGIEFFIDSIATNTHATLVSNTITSGASASGVLAELVTAGNTFCLALTGNTASSYDLFQSAGTFTLFNGGGNTGTINQSGTITPSGACNLATASGLVHENKQGDIYASLPPETETDSMTSILSEVFNFGVQTVYAQNNFNIPLGPINIGTIPAGSKVTVTFDVMANAVIPAGTTSVSLQGILSGSNLASILTDDPETSIDLDTTITALDSLQAVNALPQTGEEAWWQTTLVWILRLSILGFGLAGIIAIRRHFFRSL